MRKELILAIFLGGILGLSVAFGVWRFTTTLKDDSSNDSPIATATSQQNSDNAAPPQSTNTEGLTIVRPQDNAIATSDSIQVAGITRPNSYVLISAAEDYVVQTNSGTFEQDIEITGGINQIQVHVFTEGQAPQQTSVVVIYSSDIEASENTRAVLGAITDITETSLQVRTANGEISQVAISEGTSYVSTIQTTKDIKFEDLAIGDFIAAVGQMDEDEVLNAHRIIVSSPLEESNDVVAYGTVQTLTSRDFIVKNEASGDEWSIDATDRPTVTAMNDEGEIETARLTATAEEGDWIIIVGKMEDDELIARRIHIL